MGDFTYPIPKTVISRVPDVSAGDDENRFRDLSQGLIRGFIPFATTEEMTIAESSLREIADWVREMAAERRKTLGEDLISDLLRAQEKDDTLQDDEIVIAILLSFGAANRDPEVFEDPDRLDIQRDVR